MKKQHKIGVVGVDDAIIASLVSTAISKAIPFITGLINQGQEEIVALDKESSLVFKPLIEQLFQKYPSLKNVKYADTGETFEQQLIGIQRSIDGAKGKGKNDYQANLNCLQRVIILTVLPYEPSLQAIVQNFVPRKNWNCTEKAENFVAQIYKPTNQNLPTANNLLNNNLAPQNTTGISFTPNTNFYLLLGALAVGAYYLYNQKSLKF